MPGEAEQSTEVTADAAPAGAPGPATDALVEATMLARQSADAGVPVKLLGGLAVRVLCPEFPPRRRTGQDMDFACRSQDRRKVLSVLEELGCEGDRRFNALNGDRQMYLTSPEGRPIDVIVDRLVMCHTLDFRPTFDRRPLTLDVVDVLLSKLQIVEINEKDVRDACQLMARFEVLDGPGDGIDGQRFDKVLGGDWGWWRTVTKNLEKIVGLLGETPELAPPGALRDPAATARALLERAEAAPKSAKWKMRAKLGERARWYELPEEVDH